jgi:hypothetical protein
MKKMMTMMIALLFTSIAMFAQENVEPQLAKNVVKLNLTSLLYSYPELEYERLLSGDMGVGASIAFPLEDFEIKFRFTPYYRFYFSKFFIEANTALLIVDDYNNTYKIIDGYAYYNFEKSSGNKAKIGFGCAVGYKYVNQKNGIIGEVFCGVGRSIGNDDVYAYPRVGITIGKQF